jgi:twinkle protein
MKFKDCNDCRMAGVSAQAIQACVAGARDFAPDKVKNAGKFEAELIDEWLNKRLDTGLLLPLDFPDFSIRPAELTIWTGIEKSGKTTLLGFCLMGLMAQGERAMVCSFETKARKTLKKFSRQASGILLYDRKIVEQCRSEKERNNYRASATEKIKETSRWLARNLWLYDHTGIAQWRTLIDDIRWARRRHGITQFVIDNFMRLGFVKDDYGQQAECATALSALAMELEVHIHLVVHQNKSEGQKGQAGGKRSVSGAFEIIANAHNIVEVQRDVNKGEKVSEVIQDHKIGRINDQEMAERLKALNEVPDAKFILHAQREGEQQNASKYLWFLWESQQYVSHPKGHPNHKQWRFVDEAAEANRQAADRDLPTSEEIGL